jgi:hypothetical protein
MSTSARHDVDEGEAATPAEPGLRDTDPVGAQIYWYPARPPTGTWAYIVDDTGLRYRRQGWWPFRRGNAADERRQIGAARASAARRGVSFEHGDLCGWASVRLAPDTEYCAAGQNYVTLWPSSSCPWKVSADLHLYVRPQGMCAVVVRCRVEIDLRDMTPTLHQVHDDWPAELKAQAAEKAAKLVAFLAEHITRRNAGRRKLPPTAHERWAANR